MKQATFTGNEIDVSDFKQQRNQDRGPDPDDNDHVTFTACSHCDISATQEALRIGPQGLCIYNCYCVCHGDTPQEEACNPEVFLGGDNDIRDVLSED